MSLEHADKNEYEQQLAGDDSGILSYALDALSELHGAVMEPLAPEPAVPPVAAVPAPEPQHTPEPRHTPETEPEETPPGAGRLESLQSALDWYKDWLSSM